jgi:hypothetical protein
VRCSSLCSISTPKVSSTGELTCNRSTPTHAAAEFGAYEQ